MSLELRSLRVPFAEKLIGEVQCYRDYMKKLFVGNLSFKLDESDLEQLFAQSGKVVSVAIPTDRDSGRKRGFAFVEMETDAEAEAAVQSLNGKDVDGRAIAVNLSRPKDR